jgi:hypothetical protein
MRISSLCHLAFAAILATPALAAEDKDFTIVIDGKELGINAGDTVNGTTKSGTPVQIKLKRNEFSTYSEPGFSFRHRSDLSISTTDIADDIRQILMTSALGSLTIIQTYKNFDPHSMAQVMLDQLTVDDRKVGAKIDSRPTTRKLSGGTEMTGLAASVTLNQRSVVNYEIVTATIGDGGVLAIARMDDDFKKSDQAIIDLFWSSLKIDGPAP